MDMRGMKKISREERRRKARETAERNKKIELAMKEVVENGMALRAAAKAYDVRRSTLQDHLKRPARQEPHHPKNTTFSAEQEAVLLEHIRNMAAIDYGYTPFQIIDLAQNMSRLCSWTTAATNSNSVCQTKNGGRSLKSATQTMGVPDQKNGQLQELLSLQRSSHHISQNL